MNIKETILIPEKFSKENAAAIVNYASSSKKKFKELMQCFLSNEYRLQQRAAWCVSITVQQNKDFIKPYIPLLVKQLSKKNVHDAVIRNSLRILQIIEIPEKNIGETMNVCFSFVENPATPTAFKVFALTILSNISKKIPDIKNEIKLLIDYQIENASAGFKARAGRVLKELDKN